MNFKVILVFCILGIITLKTNSLQPECERKLGEGSVICMLTLGTDFEESKFNLCTHIVLSDTVNKLCGRRNGQIGFCTETGDDYEKEFNRTVDRLIPNFKGLVGLEFNVGQVPEQFIPSRLQRFQIGRSLIKIMTERGFSFVVFADKKILSTEKVKNYILFMQTHASFTGEIKPANIVYKYAQELARLVHDENWMVGMYASYTPDAVQNRYGLSQLFRYIDWISFGYGLRTVTFDDENEQATRVAAPLGVNKDEDGSIKAWIEDWLKHVKPECLLMGLLSGGLSYTGKYLDVDPGLGSIVGAEPVALRFAEICRQLYFRDCQRYWDEDSSTPWAACQDDFITYDDERSISLKANLAQLYKLTGVYYQYESIDSCGDLGDSYSYLRGAQAIKSDRQKTTKT